MNSLTKEDIEFIKNLSHEMKTQDNRGTAHPFGLVIRDESIEYGFEDGYTDEQCIVWGEECYHDFCEYRNAVEERLREEEEENSDECDKWSKLYTSLLLCGDYEIGSWTQILEDEDMRILGYKTYRTADNSKGLYEGNFFLTEKACKAHLDSNKHHFKNPDTYGIHLTRNPEMAKLYEVIHKLAEVL